MLNVRGMRKTLEAVKTAIQKGDMSSLTTSKLVSNYATQRAIIESGLISKSSRLNPFVWVGGVVDDKVAQTVIDNIRRIRIGLGYQTGKTYPVPVITQAVEPQKVNVVEIKNIIEEAKKRVDEAMMALGWAVYMERATA